MHTFTTFNLIIHRIERLNIYIYNFIIIFISKSFRLIFRVSVHFKKSFGRNCLKTKKLVGYLLKWSRPPFVNGRFQCGDNLTQP